MTDYTTVHRDFPADERHNCKDHSHTAAEDGGTLTGPVVTNYIEFAEATTPSTPAAGKQRLYPKSGGKWFRKDSGGTETQLIDSTGIDVQTSSYPLRKTDGTIAGYLRWVSTLVNRVELFGSGVAAAIRGGDGATVFAGYPNGGDIQLRAGGNTDKTQVYYGNMLLNSAPLATSATVGFVGLPSMPGPPSGTPDAMFAASGVIPAVMDSVTGILYIYVGSAWTPVHPRRKVNTITADTTLTDAHDVVLIDDSSSVVNVTFPLAAGRSGKTFTVISLTSINGVHYLPTGSDTFGTQGNTDITHVNEQAWVFISNGIDKWLVLANAVAQSGF